MIVRSFHLSDYASVNQLFQEVLAETCYEDTMEALARQLSWDSELVLVAAIEGEIVGSIIGTIDHEHGYYYRIAVSENHRRKGIARSMIQSLKQRFERRQVRRILVNADAHNEQVLPVYASAGYIDRDFYRATNRLSIVGG